jgi:peptide/nickel transport system permease protein
MKDVLKQWVATLAKRLLAALAVMWAVVTLVFILIHCVPGDPALLYLGDNARPEDVRRLRHTHGLDLSLWEQYRRLWLGARSSAPNADGAVDRHRGLLRGDFGETFSGKSVTKELVQRYPATLQLACAAMLTATLISIPLGVVSAVRRGTWIDSLVSVVSLGGIALPNFVLGPLAIALFAVQLRWFPVSGSDDLSYLVLPAFTLGVAMAAILTRLVRSSVLEELGEEYVRTARAKGLRERTTLFKHVLKNGMIPVVTIIGLQFGVVLTGAIITETIFSWPGVGELTIRSINEREYQQVQANLLAIALTYVVVNTATDMAYRLLDPRIKTD